MMSADPCKSKLRNLYCNIVVYSYYIWIAADIIFIEDNPLDDMAILTKPNNIMRVFQDGAEVKNRYGLM